MLEKCVLTILELNWNQRLGHKKTKLNICHHRLTSSTQLQNSSFDVVERTRTSSKCQKLKNARAKRAKILFFIVKYANLSGFCCRRRRGCLSSHSQGDHVRFFSNLEHQILVSPSESPYMKSKWNKTKQSKKHTQLCINWPGWTLHLNRQPGPSCSKHV